MSDFLIREAIDEDDESAENKREEIEIETVSDNEFIDDTEFDESGVADYYAFTNVTRDYHEAVEDSLSDFDIMIKSQIITVTIMKLICQLMILKITRKELIVLKKL